MKRTLYIGALAATMTLGLGSCGDLLNIDPFNAIGTDNALVTNSDFTNALRGIYRGMHDVEYYGGQFIATPDILSDNLILSAEGRTSQITRHYWNFAGNNTWAIWDDGYRVILRANLILENIDAIADADFAAEVQAEALALRAMVHFDMARIYCKPPQYASGTDLGIPYMTSSDASQKPARPTVTDMFNNIIADLEAAAPNVPAQDVGLGRLTRDAAYGLLARAKFYAGDNTGALAALNEVLPAAGSADGLVTPRDEFEDLWKDESKAGILWNVRMTELDNVSPGVQYSQTGSDGVRSEYVVDYGLYQLYEDNANGTGDIRLDAYFQTSDFAGKTQNHIAKWFGRPTGSANLTDVQVLRAEELLLTRAEITYDSDPANALLDLNTVRDARYTAYPGGETGQDLLDAIQRERRKELAFEGHRFFDLKRLNVDINRSTFGDAADGTGATLPATVLNLPAGDDRFQLPIPQGELNANENMVQNPGY